MEVFVYCRRADGVNIVDRLASSLRADLDVRSFNTLADLARMLRTPARAAVRTGILCPLNEPELSALAASADLFEDLDLIVVAPNRRKKTLSTAHRLRPRYLAFLDDGIESLLAVLENIVNRAASRKIKLCQLPAITENSKDVRNDYQSLNQ
jgi:hypothetical protein